jgi:hypothetical protein
MRDTPATNPLPVCSRSPRRIAEMRKLLIALGLLAAVAFTTPRPAEAGVSVSIGLPGFGIYVPGPPIVYAPPPPVYYAPPAYYAPPVYYRPHYRPYYGRPVYGRPYYGGYRGHRGRY